MPLKHDLSHVYVLKTAIEQILGRDAWYELKETTSVAPWRKCLLKLVAAIRLSIDESVQVADADWLLAVHENLDRGTAHLKKAKGFDELLVTTTAVLLRQVFLQIGQLPDRRGTASVTLSRENWRLNGHRSVQYVQSKEQLEAVFWMAQQRRIGFERQMELHNEHRHSKSKLSYSEWSRARED